jgi:hypothetical protein
LALFLKDLGRDIDEVALTVVNPRAVRAELPDRVWQTMSAFHIQCRTATNSP